MLYLLIVCIIFIVINYFYQFFDEDKILGENPKNNLKLSDPTLYMNENAKIIVMMGTNKYDVTDFISKHPGGKTIIAKHNGKDITEPMKSIGHSDRAYKILNKYIV